MAKKKSKKNTVETPEKLGHSPGLACLYLGFALRNLVAIDKAIKSIEVEGRVDLIPLISAMHKERDKLTETCYYHREAATLLAEIRLTL